MASCFGDHHKPPVQFEAPFQKEDAREQNMEPNIVWFTTDHLDRLGGHLDEHRLVELPAVTSAWSVNFHRRATRLLVISGDMK